MCVAAFHIGLLERVGELSGLLASDTTIYSHGYSATELQRIMSKRALPDFIDTAKLCDMLNRILELAESGLRQRGMNEEIFLAPLYDRAKNLSNPSLVMVDDLENGKNIEEYIRLYSKL